MEGESNTYFNRGLSLSTSWWKLPAHRAPQMFPPHSAPHHSNRCLDHDLRSRGYTFRRTEVSKFFEPVSSLFFLVITALSEEKKQLVVSPLILFHSLNSKTWALAAYLETQAKPHPKNPSLFQTAVLASEIQPHTKCLLAQQPGPAVTAVSQQSSRTQRQHHLHVNTSS